MAALRPLIRIAAVLLVIAELVVGRHLGAKGQPEVEVHAAPVLERIERHAPSAGDAEVEAVALLAVAAEGVGELLISGIEAHVVGPPRARVGEGAPGKHVAAEPLEPPAGQPHGLVAVVLRVAWHGVARRASRAPVLAELHVASRHVVDDAGIDGMMRVPVVFPVQEDGETALCRPGKVPLHAEVRRGKHPVHGIRANRKPFEERKVKGVLLFHCRRGSLRLCQQGDTADHAQQDFITESQHTSNRTSLSFTPDMQKVTHSSLRERDFSCR